MSRLRLLFIFFDLDMKVPRETAYLITVGEVS